MKIWEVGVSDCENSSTFCLCATKEIALRELFKKRDEIVNEYKLFISEYKPIKCNISEEDQVKMEKEMYEPMMRALSGDDYENWNNYPHETPWIRETDVIMI